MNRAMRRSQRLDANDFRHALTSCGIVRAERLDDNETMTFARQLEAIDTELYRVRYPDMKWDLLVPKKTDVPAGADQYTYRSATEVGEAEWSANLRNGAPRVDLFGEEIKSPIHSIIDGYGYSIQDLRRAKLTGIPIDSEKAMTARKAIARKINRAVLLGDATLGLVGFYNASTVQSVSPVTGTWSSATPDQILADLQKLEGEIISDSSGVEQPDTLVLPPTLYAKASTARLSNTETTALDFFLKKSQSIKNVETDALLETAGSGGVPRIVAYTRSPEKLVSIVPVEFEELPPEPKAYEFEINCHARCGGTVIRYPGSMAYMDGC